MRKRLAVSTLALVLAGLLGMQLQPYAARPHRDALIAELHVQYLDVHWVGRRTFGTSYERYWVVVIGMPRGREGSTEPAMVEVFKRLVVPWVKSGDAAVLVYVALTEDNVSPENQSYTLFACPTAAVMENQDPHEVYCDFIGVGRLDPPMRQWRGRFR